MTFAHPAVLGCLVLLPWLWWVGTNASRGRVVWRLVTLFLLILAAAGVGIVTGSAPLSVIAVLDRSASVPLSSQQRAVERVSAIAGTMRAQDRLGVVTFGAEAAVERRPVSTRAFTTVSTSPADFASDISAGLRVARSLLPLNGARRVWLISDGQETSGYAEREALDARAAGIAIDVVVPERPTATELMRVSRVVAPSDVAAHEPYLVSVEIAGPPGAHGDVTLYRDDQLMTSAPVTAGADGRASLAISDRRDDPGPYVYRALMVDGGGLADDAAGEVVTVSGAARVLYITARNGTLEAALTGAGFIVTRTAPRDAPASAAALNTFAAIVLDDVSADEVAQESLQAIRDYVEQDGGGLLLLGSARSLTLEGFPSSPLEPILPIDLRPRSGARTTSLAIVVVFDKSGSMADAADGVPKIEAARQAVARVAEVLPPSDAIGVLAFDSRPVAVQPIAFGLAPGVLSASLDAVSPGGSTTIAPALDLANRWLHDGVAANVTRRQILLLSDGRTSDADAERMRQVVAAHRDVTLSVVAIGRDSNRLLLESLATMSGGRAYFPGNVRDLPRLVAREAARSSGGGVVEERFLPRAAAHPVLEGLDAATLPALGGYVIGGLKPTASPILASHLGDPVLSSGRAGLGRVAVFTADLNGPWGRALRDWRDGPRLWSQAVRWLSRRDAGGDLRIRVTDAQDGTHIEVASDRAGGNGVTVDSVRATVHTPGEADRDVELSAVAPGRYDGRLAALRPGPSVIAVTARDPQGEERRVVRTIYHSASREHQSTQINRPLLQRLAALTGGRVVGDAESPFVMERPRGYSDAAPAVLAIALVMFVIDLGVGRGRRPRRDLVKEGVMTPKVGGVVHG